MRLSGKKVVVTGAEGFIGSHLIEALLQQDCDIKAFVNYNSRGSHGWLDNSPVAEKIEVFAGDVRNGDTVLHALDGYDVVFHLAALIGIPYSYISPSSYVDTNITGTLNIMQAARKLGLEKVIHTSSSEVYGSALFVPITEEHPLQGQSPYSATKIGADHLALSFHSSFATPIAVVRPFNTYGPRQSTRAVIPTIITQLLKGNNDIKLGAISPTRDFNYVEDTVSGFIAAAQSDRAIGEVINIGLNFEVSIGDTAKIIAETLQQPINIICENERLRPENSEVDRLFACNEKAFKLLDWQPNFGGIEGFKRGIAKTVEWFSRPENLCLYDAENYQV